MFEPKEVRDGKWTGGVQMRSPDYEARLSLAAEFLDAEGQGKSQSENVRIMMKVVPFVKNHVQEMNLTRLSDNKQFKTYNDLNADPSAHSIITQLCNLFIEQLNLGNESGQTSDD